MTTTSVGQGSLLVERPLGRLAGGERLLAPAARGGEPGEPLLARGVDEDDPVAERSPSRPRAGSPRRARRPEPRPGGRRGRWPARTSAASAGGGSPRGRRSAAGSAKTIAPRARRSIARRLVGLAGGVEDPRAEPRDDLLADRRADRAGRDRPCRRRSRTRPAPPGSAATRLLPAPMPPISPITGIGPCFQGPAGRARPVGLRAGGAMGIRVELGT